MLLGWTLRRKNKSHRLIDRSVGNCFLCILSKKDRTKLSMNFFSEYSFFLVKKPSKIKQFFEKKKKQGERVFGLYDGDDGDFMELQFEIMNIRSRFCHQ